MADQIPDDLLRIATRKWPRRVALRHGAESWTFSDLDYAATEVAGRVPAGERIAFRAEMSVATVVAAWGIPRGGGVAVPIDPAADAGRAAAEAASFGATLGWPQGRVDWPAEREPDLAAAAFILGTSGTSGARRGAIITFGNIAGAASASQLHLGTGEADVWLLAMPLHHIAGLAILWRAAHDGSQVVLQDGFVPARFAAALRAASWTSVVPTMLRRLVAEPGPYPVLRGLLVGGAHTTSALLTQAAGAGLPALATYGMTETTAQVATVRPGQAAAAVGTVGFPLPGVEITIDAAPGEVGSILIDGPTVSPGYVAGPLRRGPFRTSDLGRFDSSGRLVVIGRSDDVVITGGENVDPQQVEEALLDVPGVEAAAVFGVPDPEWGERVVAFVVGDVAVAAVLESVATHLPSFAVPKEVRIVAAMPLLSNGKIDRAALQASLGSPEWR